MNNKERIVHVNRLRPLLRPDRSSVHSEGLWSPPLFQYYCDDHQAPAPQQEPSAAPQSGQRVTTRSGRVVRPVDYYAHAQHCLIVIACFRGEVCNSILTRLIVVF